MKVRLILMSVVVASSSLLAISAKAHDPAEFDRMMAAPQPVPTTCAQLTDPHNYSNDMTNKDIKALKARCDAADQATTKATAQKKTPPKPSK